MLVFFISRLKILTLKPERENYVQFDGIHNIKAVELVFGTVSQVKSNFV